MKEIIIKTQKDLDNLPEKFEEYTRIIINEDSDKWIIVRLAREHSSVVACGNSSVVARENSSVVAWENSSVEAWGNSSVEAWGNSSVVACGNSSVEAWENSSVVACGNSSVVACGNSSVVAWENSSVVAWENSSVEAWGNSIVRIFWDAVKVILHGFSVAFLPITVKLKINIKKESEYAIVQKIKDLDWFERSGIEKKKELILYKKVSKDFKTQEGKINETDWKIGSTVEHKNWCPDKEECGEGKFHACSRPYFCDEFRNEIGDRYIAIKVNLKDVYSWDKNPQYPYKIGFRKGEVMYEVNKFGKEIKA